MVSFVAFYMKFHIEWYTVWWYCWKIPKSYHFGQQLCQLPPWVCHIHTPLAVLLTHLTFPPPRSSWCLDGFMSHRAYCPESLSTQQEMNHSFMFQYDAASPPPDKFTDGRWRWTLIGCFTQHAMLLHCQWICLHQSKAPVYHTGLNELHCKL